MGYQPQPPTAYNQRPGYNQPYYPPPNAPQPYYYPLPVAQRPANKGMKAAAIALIATGFALHVISFFPVIGFVIGLFGLLCYLLGFIFLCLI